MLRQTFLYVTITHKCFFGPFCVALLIEQATRSHSNGQQATEIIVPRVMSLHRRKRLLADMAD